MSALQSAHLPEHHDADTILVTRMIPGTSKAAREPTVDIQASSAQQDLKAAPGLPLFDLSEFLVARHGPSAEQNTFCEEVASCLQQTGCLIVRDPRVSPEQSDCFLDMMERYFSQPTALKMPDVHPELHYQVGATPEGVEVPRCVIDPDCLRTIEQQLPGHRATVPPGADPKWRFFWRLGPRPARTQFAELNAAPVIPAAFSEWREVMDGWGEKMLGTVSTVSEIVAVGLGLDRDAFTSRMQMGPHLLAPTGVDLEKYGAAGTCYAGYHYDLNFLTIHGKSRFPGLAVWLQDGRRMPVSIPDGCLLIQAGKQIEWLTNGFIHGGMHEVICTEATQAATARAKAAGRVPYRVSSTVFAHIASDEVLQPIGRFAEEHRKQLYTDMLAGEFVQQELEVIKLKRDAPC